MPIKGLEFADDDVLFEGRSFSDLSQAQQIQVSMAIAIAENPKLKIVRILNGSLLDSDAMKEIKKIAEDNDYQIWIEKVANGPSGGNAVYIEDGQVVE
jgi:ABC-type ATPase with predicted acetyltransferase domain